MSTSYFLIYCFCTVFYAKRFVLTIFFVPLDGFHNVLSEFVPDSERVKENSNQNHIMLSEWLC